MFVNSRHVAAVLFLVVTGCHAGGGYRSAYVPPPPDYSSAYNDPVVAAPVDPGLGVAAGEKTFVDRHPLLSAPRNYYRDSSDNVLVKAFYGTVVGIPVGIARETLQIFYGQ